MKVIFMGTPDFSTGVLESIIEAGHEVTAVVTQPDKPKGRGHKMQFTQVKEVALKYNLPVANKKDSQDICFGRRYQNLLRQRLHRNLWYKQLRRHRC